MGGFTIPKYCSDSLGDGNDSALAFNKNKMFAVLMTSNLRGYVSARKSI